MPAGSTYFPASLFSLNRNATHVNHRKLDSNLGLPLKTDSAFQDRHVTEPIPIKAIIIPRSLFLMAETPKRLSSSTKLSRP